VTRQLISTAGAGSFPIPLGVTSITVGGTGGGAPGAAGFADDEGTPGNQASAGAGGAGGGFGGKALACSYGQTLYYRVGASGETTWFHLGTNTEAGGWSVGQGSTKTAPAAWDTSYSGGGGGNDYHGTIVANNKAGGGGGGAGAGGNGGNGGNAAIGVNGIAGTGGAASGGLDGGGGGAAGNAGNGAAPGGGGGGGINGAGEGAGGIGQLTITYAAASITSVDAGAITPAGGAIVFAHGYRTSIDAGAIALVGGDIAFGGATVTHIDGGTITLAGGNVSFSTGGGTPVEDSTVLPNEPISARALQASLSTMQFRNSDTVPTRTAKLELLREGQISKTLMLSIIGLPDADPADPLLRLELLDALAIGEITATAGIGATGSPAFRFKLNGAANGTITFAGTSGTDTGIEDYAAGSLLELYPPSSADATLDDVSISIRVICRIASTANQGGNHGCTHKAQRIRRAPGREGS
jgi:hypothetical protein